MPAPMTAPRPSCSRRRCRFTAGISPHRMLALFADPGAAVHARDRAGDLEEPHGRGFRAGLARRAGGRRRRRTPPARKPTCRCAADAGTPTPPAPPDHPLDDPVPPRSACLGWPLRQQRLAAGTAAAADEADLGQSAADLAGAGAQTRAAQRRPGALLAWAMRASRCRPGSCRARRRTASWRCSASAAATSGTVGERRRVRLVPADRPRRMRRRCARATAMWTLACTEHHDVIFDARRRLRRGTARSPRSPQGPALSRRRQAEAAPLSLEARTGRPPGA